MSRTPLPEAEACWVCKHLRRQCYEDCDNRLRPDDSSLLGPDGRPRSKNDLYVQLMHVQHGHRQLREMGTRTAAEMAIAMTTPTQDNAGSSQQERSSPEDQNRALRFRRVTAMVHAAAAGQTVRADAVLDPVPEAGHDADMPDAAAAAEVGSLSWDELVNHATDILDSDVTKTLLDLELDTPQSGSTDQSQVKSRKRKAEGDPS